MESSYCCFPRESVSFVRPGSQAKFRRRTSYEPNRMLMSQLSHDRNRERIILRPWQTRTHCCGQIVADTKVSPFARARNICCGHKFCVRETKNVSDFPQKHFVPATNVSKFAQPKKHHGQQCVRKNVSLFTRALNPLYRQFVDTEKRPSFCY